MEHFSPNFSKMRNDTQGGEKIVGVPFPQLVFQGSNWGWDFVQFSQAGTS